MNSRKAQQKLFSAMHYLRSTYGHDDADVNAAWFELTCCSYSIRDAAINRNAGRKAARKYGQRCRMELICGENPSSRIIEELAINEAIKLAVKAAQNAFWAHPELRG
jgi:hypothetical protein